MELPFYSVKILDINKGSEGGLQYHHFKTECGLILKGSLEIKSEHLMLQNFNDMF